MAAIKKPLRNLEYQLEEMDNELLLFNPQNLLVLYLNESSSIIWQLCNGQRTIHQIAELITDAYPEAAASVLEDVEETIKLFTDQGAVTLI